MLRAAGRSSTAIGIEGQTGPRSLRAGTVTVCSPEWISLVLRRHSWRREEQRDTQLLTSDR